MIKSFVKTGLLALSSILCHNKKSKVIFYHDIFGETKYTDMGTPLSLFEKHLVTFRNCGFKIVDEITDKNNQLKICFDDGFRGIYDVKDIFIKNYIHPTVFLAVDLVGKEGYLNVAEIEDLQNHGFKFQCHGWSHTNLTEFSAEELKTELHDSKKEIEKITGIEVNEICFPIGYYSSLVLQKCEEYGFRKMYSSIPGNYFDDLGTKGLISRNLLQFCSAFQVRCILHGGLDMFKKRYIKMHYLKQIP